MPAEGQRAAQFNVAGRRNVERCVQEVDGTCRCECKRYVQGAVRGGEGFVRIAARKIERIAGSERDFAI